MSTPGETRKKKKKKKKRHSLAYHEIQRLRAASSCCVLGRSSSPCLWRRVAILRSCWMSSTFLKSGACRRCMYFSGYRSEEAWLDIVAGERPLSSCWKRKGNSWDRCSEFVFQVLALSNFFLSVVRELTWCSAALYVYKVFIIHLHTPTLR